MHVRQGKLGGLGGPRRTQEEQWNLGDPWGPGLALTIHLIIHEGHFGKQPGTTLETS